MPISDLKENRGKRHRKKDNPKKQFFQQRNPRPYKNVVFEYYFILVHFLKYFFRPEISLKFWNFLEISRTIKKFCKGGEPYPKKDML